jgi:hypothetical protein
MIKLTKKQIYNMTPLGSRVLIKPNRKLDEIYLTRGEKLFFDPSYNPEQHAPVTGEVILVPLKTKVDSILDFESKVVLKQGDFVIFSYIAGSVSLDPRIEENIIDEDNELYFWVKYQEIYAAKRGEDRFSINHFHIVEELDDVAPTSILKLPDSMKKKSNKLAKILYAPQYPVKYNTDKLSSGAVATVGSYIVVHKNGIIPLEHEIHRSFLGRQVNPCIVAQRDVMAIVPPELIDKVK